MTAGTISLAYRRYALGLLLAVNLLNLHRPAGALRGISPDQARSEYHRHGARFSRKRLLFSYMILAPLFGWLR